MPIMNADGWMGDGRFFCTISLGSTQIELNSSGFSKIFSLEEVKTLKWNPLFYFSDWMYKHDIVVANGCRLFIFNVKVQV